METGARLLLGFILFHFFVNKVYDSHKLCEQSFGLKEKKKKKKETREKKTCDGGNSIEFESNKNAGGEKKRLQLELV